MNQPEDEDRDEGGDFPEDDDSAADWEDEAGEEEIERREPVSFDRGGIKPTTGDRQKKFFAARAEMVREAKGRERRQQILTWRILPVVVSVVILGAIGYTVRQMYFPGRAAEGEPNPPERASQPAAAAAAVDGEGDADTDAGADAGTTEAAVVSELERSLETARQLLEEKKTEDLRKLLAVLARRYPKSPELWILHGYMVMGTAPANAGAFARKALELEPGNMEALNLLSTAFEVTRARGLTQKTEVKLIELEIGAYARLLERNPDSPEALYRSASQRIALHRLDMARKEELDKAIEELDQAIELLGAEDAKRELASGYHQRGRAIKHQGDQLVFEGKADEAAPYYEKALRDFFAAIEVDGDRVDSLGEIVLIRNRQGDDAKAIEDMEAALAGIEKDAARAKAHEMLGVLYHQSGDFDEARANYDRALEINEKMLGSLIGLAGVHIARGEMDQAQERLEETIHADPNFLEGHFRLGQFFLSEKRSDEAIASFEAALRVPRDQARTIEMNPSKNLARARFYYGSASALAWLYIEEENDPLKAGQAVELAQKFQPADPHLLDTVGWIYYQSGNFEKAAETFENVIEASGGFPAAHYHLAASYAKLNRNEDALREVERALEGNDAFSHRAEAEALRKALSGEGER